MDTGSFCCFFRFSSTRANFANGVTNATTCLYILYTSVAHCQCQTWLVAVNAGTGRHVFIIYTYIIYNTICIGGINYTYTLIHLYTLYTHVFRCVCVRVRRWWGGFPQPPINAVIIMGYLTRGIAELWARRKDPSPPRHRRRSADQAPCNYIGTSYNDLTHISAATCFIYTTGHQWTHTYTHTHRTRDFPYKFL